MHFRERVQHRFKVRNENKFFPLHFLLFKDKGCDVQSSLGCRSLQALCTPCCDAGVLFKRIEYDLVIRSNCNVNWGL